MYSLHNRNINPWSVRHFPTLKFAFYCWLWFWNRVGFFGLFPATEVKECFVNKPAHLFFVTSFIFSNPRKSFTPPMASFLLGSRSDEKSELFCHPLNNKGEKMIISFFFCTYLTFLDSLFVLVPWHMLIEGGDCRRKCVYVKKTLEEYVPNIWTLVISDWWEQGWDGFVIHACPAPLLPLGKIPPFIPFDSGVVAHDSTLAQYSTSFLYLATVFGVKG